MTPQFSTQLKEQVSYSSNLISYRWLSGDYSIFEKITPELRFQFFKEVHSNLFRCSFFNTMDPSFAVKVISLLKP